MSVRDVGPFPLRAFANRGLRCDNLRFSFIRLLYRMRCRYCLGSACLIAQVSIMDHRSLSVIRSAADVHLSASSTAIRVSSMLLRVAQLCDGASGRALRKYPYLAHALFVQV